MNRLIRRLLAKVTNLEERVNQLGQWHEGVVTAIGTNVVSVRLLKSTDEGSVVVEANYPGFYAPTVNDRVIVQEWGIGRSDSGSGAFLVTAAVKPHGAAAGGGGGVTDHGNLTGLADDDHPQYATNTDLSNHEADTTSVHGIADTSVLLTTSHTAAADPHTGYVLESLVDAKGDLIVGTANDTVNRLAVGAFGEALTVNTLDTPGIEWSRVRPHYGPELRRWHADLGMAHSQAVNVLLIGDSVGAGSNADSAAAPYTGPGPGAWAKTFLRRLQQSHGAGRGSQYLAANWIFLPSNGHNWSHSADVTGTTNGGLGRWAVNIGANTSTYIETVQDCDRFHIYYPAGLLGGMGAFNVIVDGVTLATVTPPGTGGTWDQVFDSGDLGPGRHTIRLQCSTTGANGPLIEGGIFFNGDYQKGVHLFNGSHGGETSAFFADPSQETWASRVGTMAPSLVIYAMGLNDLTLGTTITNFKANINYALNLIRTNTTNDPSEVILIPHAHAYDDAGAGYVEHPESDWLPYRTAMYEVASARGAAVLDTYHLFGYAKDSADTADLFSGGIDEIHLNERGHRALGMLAADYLSGGLSGAVGPARLVMPSVAPETPPSGFADLHFEPFAGKLTPMVRGNIGADSVAGFPFTKTYVTNQPGTAAMNHDGLDALGSSTGTVTVATANAFAPGGVSYASGAVSGNSAGQGDSGAPWYIGSSDWAFGSGFFAYFQVVLLSTTATRVFFGLTSGTAASTVTGTDPGNHHIGFTFQSGTANWQVSSRDGTTNTKIDTGHLATVNQPVELCLWVPTKGTAINWSTRSLDIQPTYYAATHKVGNKTANLPGQTTTMRRAWYVATTEAAAKTLKVVRAYLETDR